METFVSIFIFDVETCVYDALETSHDYNNITFLIDYQILKGTSINLISCLVFLVKVSLRLILDHDTCSSLIYLLNLSEVVRSFLHDLFIINLFSQRVWRDINFPKKLAETFNKAFYIMLEILFEQQIIFSGKLFHIWHEHFNKFDELLSYVRCIALQTHDNGAYQDLIREYLCTNSFELLSFFFLNFIWCLALEIAFVQYQIQ